MFATGPANNCFIEMYSSDSYGEVTTFKGMENIRTLEMMIDCEVLALSASASNQIIFGGVGSFFFDMDVDPALADPMFGLRFVVNRGTAKTATPSDTTPSFGKRITLWAKDDMETVEARLNGASGTGVTYTALEVATQIVSPDVTNPIRIGKGVNMVYQMRLYEAAIRVNGALVFHVRPRLYMAGTATPEIVPDLSGYGNNLRIQGTYGSTFRYAPSWSRQIPYSGKENVG